MPFYKKQFFKKYIFYICIRYIPQFSRKREKSMSMNVPALGININALNNNLPKAGENQFAIPGITPSNYEGFGQVQNMGNTDDVAYFFANYADDSTNMSGPGCNIRISTENQDSGGRKLIYDIVSRAGDDAFLSEDELQAWADEIGFTGDIGGVMETMGEMDKWLCGEGTLDVEQVDPSTLNPTEPESSEPEETNPDEAIPEETNPNETDTTKTKKWPSVVDAMKGFFDGIWNFFFG